MGGVTVQATASGLLPKTTASGQELRDASSVFPPTALPRSAATSPSPFSPTHLRSPSGPRTADLPATDPDRTGPQPNVPPHAQPTVHQRRSQLETPSTCPRSRGEPISSMRQQHANDSKAWRPRRLCDPSQPREASDPRARSSDRAATRLRGNGRTAPPEARDRVADLCAWVGGGWFRGCPGESVAGSGHRIRLERLVGPRLRSWESPLRLARRRHDGELRTLRSRSARSAHRPLSPP